MEGLQCLDGRLAWLDNGRSRYEQALVAAELGSSYPDEFGFATWSVVELIEAAVRSGDTARANRALGQLRESTCAAHSDWAVGIRARCAALLADGEDAESLYLEAIEFLARTKVEVELARAHLLYGEWLRRIGRRIDARRQLRRACEIFTALNVDEFSDRAQRELLATGETSRKRSVETFSELTPQELQVSVLAGRGYTNPEIALKLFISDRTVEWHLRKVFVKLGVTSRRQLRELAR